MAQVKQNPNRIQELRHLKWWNQRELAEAAGAHWMTISKLERGAMKLTQEWMDRLAKVLDVRPEELLADSSLIRRVDISGTITESGISAPPSDYIVDEEAVHMGLEYEIDYGVSPPDTSAYYFVETSVYAPAIHTSDIVRFTAFQDPLPPEFYINRLCIVEEEGCTTRLGIMQAGRRKGAFELEVREESNRFYWMEVEPSRIYVLTLVLGLPRFPIGGLNDDETSLLP